MEMTVFLIKAVAVSLTGVLAPGAMTAATVARGTRTKWAGTEIAIGHGIVEIPLIGLLMLGLHLVFTMEPVKIVIGLAGGAFLLWLGFQMLKQKPEHGTRTKQINKGAITTGLLLSAGNPYFLFWWATVGLNLALQAKTLGPVAIVLFAVIHWLCDLVWLTILSFAAFYTHKGAGLLGQSIQKWILILCGTALLFFGGMFIFDAAKSLIK